MSRESFYKMNNMNKILQTLLTLVLFFSPILVHAVEFEIDGINYQTIGGGLSPNLTVIKKRGFAYSGDIVIPEQVQFRSSMCNVVAISNDAFTNCTELTSIVLPSTIADIAGGAFRGCVNLKSVTMNDAAAENIQRAIGSGAFSGCSSLTKIRIPLGVQGIDNDTFRDCTALETIIVSKSVQNIGPYAFRNCSSISSITAEEGNSILDSRDNCNAIIKTSNVHGNPVTQHKLILGCKNTIIPNSVTTIREAAFRHQAGLKHITIPESVTAIEYLAFSGTGLESIQVAEGNTIFDSRSNCNAIIETASNTLVVGCIKTTIPEGITTIAKGAFENTPNLTSIQLPKSVETICMWAFRECKDLKEVNIPENVTKIESMAFFDCNALTKVTSEIPADKLFAINGGDFSNASNCTLYVPYGAKSTYENTAGWSSFKEIIEMEAPTHIEEVVAKGNSRTYYDISGRITKQPSTGIYIVNGKKVVIK